MKQSTDCFIEISPQSTGHIAWVLFPFPALYVFCIKLVGFLNGQPQSFLS